MAKGIIFRIVSVRVERLQGISEADAIAEGISCWPNDGRGCQGTYGWGDTFGFATARAAYAALTNSIHGPGTWESNPFVWVYGYERAEAAK